MVRYFMIGMGIVIGMTLLLGILAGTAQAGQAASVAAAGAGWVEGTGLVCLALFAGAALLAGTVWLGTLRRMPS